MIYLAVLFSLFVLPVNAFWSKKAKDGDIVQVEYTGTLTNGSVFDTNVGNKPFMFQIGNKEVLAKFEKAIIGLKPAQSTKVFIPAAEAYGPYYEMKVIKVPLAKLPKDIKAGGKVNVKQPSGYRPFTVQKIEDEFAYIDMNHRLAAQDLNFEIKLLDIVRKKG